MFDLKLTCMGADVTVIPDSVFKRIWNAELLHSDRILCGPAFMLLASILVYIETSQLGYKPGNIHYTRSADTPNRTSSNYTSLA